jgi:hypothetical protein
MARVKLLALAVAVLVCAGVAVPAFAGTVTTSVFVSGLDGPWSYSGSLNSAYQYGVGDQRGPVVIGSSSGISFAAGNDITITYLSGTEQAGGGWPAVDANGDTGYEFDSGTGSSSTVSPAYYMNPSTYPIYLSELVGTFADASGDIVGTPFAIGDGPFTIAVPNGASQIQLGINDDIYIDNLGGFNVDVSGQGLTATPEPGSLLLLGTGILSMAGMLRRKFAGR